MGIPARSTQPAAGRRRNDPADDELRELALLEEFNRCASVTALASAISARLGRKARSKELIAEAGLAKRTLAACAAARATHGNTLARSDDR